MTKKSNAPDPGAARVRAREVSAALGAATEKLNASLTSIQAELAALNLGVTASVVMESDVSGGSEFVRELRFGKLNRDWALLFESGVVDEPDTWQSTPLLNASREIRLMAVDHVPALLVELVKTAEKEIAGVSAKADEADSLALLIKTGIPF